MKIRKVTSCLLAGLITASCSVKTPKPPIHRAERLAKEYLKRDEFIRIQNIAPALPDSLKSKAINERIFYWDSIYAYHKLHEGVDSGRAYIIDSVAGKSVKYPEFKIEADDDKRSVEEIIKDLKMKVSKYNTKEEMAQMLANEPQNCAYSDLINKITHYYGQIAVKGAEKKGFEFGVENQRYRELEKKLK